MKIVPGRRYIDGYGTEHHVVGLVPGKIGIYWTNTGFWFFEDGRLHFRVSDERTKYDLVDLTRGTEEHIEVLLPARDER